jgi:alkanesulfonate monooxygenase SsuD/methylene tetrahydromethanopterin reductase-like flavin-dependent oxidoreductase (luciferase family)
MNIRRALGVNAGLDAGLARDLAVQCEQLGYHSLWSNDEPAASGLETLALFETAAQQIELGVGVLPLDRHQPHRIVEEIDRLGLNPARLWIGIGSGQLRAPISIIQQAFAELRELLPEPTRIVVAAMRPRMCRLGGAIADGVLLNWMLPMRDEEDHYRNINEDHRKHFEAMDAPHGSVGVAASTRPEVLNALAPYHSALDLPIVRLIAPRDRASLQAAVDAAAP